MQNRYKASYWRKINKKNNMKTKNKQEKITKI